MAVSLWQSNRSNRTYSISLSFSNWHFCFVRRLASGVCVCGSPFTCCALPNFISDETAIEELRAEVLALKYVDKDNDLYRFQQVSRDAQFFFSVYAGSKSKRGREKREREEEERKGRERERERERERGRVREREESESESSAPSWKLFSKIWPTRA